MGRKLDAFLGRNLKATKLRPLLNLALSRLAILTSQRHARRSQAQSDVVQLLHLRYHPRALLRIDQLIKEQSALDAYVLIERYLNLLIETTSLLEQQRECPEELKEAVSGLIFAASRCGDFPELHQIKSIFTLHFGKEFTARAVELRNNCGVNHLLVQKLSTRQPDLETRMELLKAISSENGIELQFDQSPSSNLEKLPVLKVHDEVPSGSKQQKYKDVADAAQAAFESAAEAADAARAVMELSRTEHQRPGSETSPHDKQDRKKPEVESESKSETECRNGREEDEGEGNGEMDEQRRSNDEIESKSDNIEATQKASFRLNLEKKPISVRTRRMRGY